MVEGEKRVKGLAHFRQHKGAIGAEGHILLPVLQTHSTMPAETSQSECLKTPTKCTKKSPESLKITEVLILHEKLKKNP